MKFTFRDIVWVGIIALIVIILSKCHRDKANKLNEDVKALLVERHATDSIHNVASQAMENKINGWIGKVQNAHDTLVTIQAKLDRSMATTKRLTTELRVARNWPIDTTAITVSGEYVNYCDSLANTSDSIMVAYATYKRHNARLLLSKDSAFTLQREQYLKEFKARQDCNKDFTALQHFYKEADKRSKPTNQVFIGAELLGSQQLLVQNVGVALSLKTKTNQLWQVSGGVQNGGGWYGRLNGNILIRLRK